MRTAVVLSRDGEHAIFVAESLTDIARELDYEIPDLVRDPAFRGYFERLTVVDWATMTVTGHSWKRVA